MPNTTGQFYVRAGTFADITSRPEYPTVSATRGAGQVRRRFGLPAQAAQRLVRDAFTAGALVNIGRGAKEPAAAAVAFAAWVAQQEP